MRIVFSGILLLLLIFSACSPDKKAEEQEGNITTVLPDQPNEVKVMRLEYAVFNHEIISNGTVSAAHKADLKFDSPTPVAEIYVKNGDRVTAGQKIAMQDQFKLRNNLAAAKDHYERAGLELQDVLIGQGYTLKDTAKIPAEVMKIARIKSNFDQSRIQCELAEFELKHSVLYAPFSGVIANLFTKKHNIPDPSLPFCSVIENAQPELDFMILENELLLVNVGDPVFVSPYAINDYEFSGRISEINPMVDKNGMVRVKALVANTGGKLIDGMNVKVKIQRSLEKQLVIPKEALVLRSNKQVVFVSKNGLAQWVYVQTGMENSTNYTITEGLSEGDSVIYEGNVNLAHETPVIVKN